MNLVSYFVHKQCSLLIVYQLLMSFILFQVECFKIVPLLEHLAPSYRYLFCYHVPNWQYDNLKRWLNGFFLEKIWLFLEEQSYLLLSLLNKFKCYVR